ncbi:haloacid dehalogenase superfamily, subfamily IA, variant 3 with third motif having DD or ED/beta-phosphoglucomutase family hydrolase [bacterium A37T11]|nr:haloacid dehalogenase superfamily, subfamily IA, variant 3 with third motif having DD or ED/beta-phosphoglucomutase family hydrolase [bacterium A37T11]
MRAVIFDMDGVIADTNPYHSEAFKQFFDKYHVPYTMAEFADHMYGKHNSYIMKYFFKKDLSPEEIRSLEEEKERLFRKIYALVAKPIDGLMPFIKELRQIGFKTAIATSAPKANLDLIVEKLDLRDKMDSLLSSEDVTKHKPDPEVYLNTASALGVDPGQCVVFEDSFSGVSAGLNAGMKVVGVLTSHNKEELPPCQLYIKDFREITAQDIERLLVKFNVNLQ